jgi:hypothetical protein
MAWNTILPTHLKDEGLLSASEYASVTTASLPEGKTGEQVTAEVISSVITDARGYIAANAENILGVEGTIPDELRATVLIIVRYRVFTRLPKMKALLDELRVNEYKEAMSKLRNDVPSGKFKLVQPLTPADADQQAGGGSVGLVSGGKKRMRRENTGGLF